MKSSEYFKKIDINKYFLSYKNDFLEVEYIKNYLTKNGDEGLILFSEMFWHEPSYGIKKIKEELGIPNNIAFVDIIKSYPSELYIQFLKEIYLERVRLEEVSLKYNIPINRIKELLIYPVIELEESCPKCLKNKFSIDMLRDNVRYTCDNCKKITEALLNEEEKNEKLEILRIKEQEFELYIEGIYSQIDNVKCPKCQCSLIIMKDMKRYSYKILCEKCDYMESDYKRVIQQYKLWEKRAAMMLAIKAREERIIKDSLKSKQLHEINFKEVEIIYKNEFLNRIKFWEDSNCWNNEIIRDYEILKDIIKGCTRLEINMLIKLIEIANSKGAELKLVGQYISVNFDYPLVGELIDITGIIDVRTILRSLMKKNVIAVNEEDNIIIVPKFICRKSNEIKSLNYVQDVNPQLRFLAMARQNFACSTCGECGRRLKIAYLTSNKNTLDLNEIVVLCEDCFELLTINEIVIDGAVSFDNGISDISKSMRFLVKNLPEVEGSTRLYEAIELMEEEYGVEETIKALAITLYQIENRRVDKEIEKIINYTYGILRKTVSSESESIVTMYESVYKRYRLDRYNIDDICVKKY
ncbi:hypothetical protein [Clostridium sp. 1001271B_151109_B4]|uniref:hypothetical protein n=1 Tax=Clostridium sp. 1001271B_151109_B4 TaxID=2787148 RepID=UPI0018ABE1B4|nr:hypothetical protein [Clostridium sp. 1001271B_151109_B4]